MQSQNLNDLELSIKTLNKKLCEYSTLIILLLTIIMLFSFFILLKVIK